MKEEKLSEKRKQNTSVSTVIILILMVFSIAVFLGTRIYCLMEGFDQALDPFGYRRLLMMKADQAFNSLTTGIAYAYTESLSVLLKMVHERKWSIALFHCVQQLIAYVLLFFGVRFLFGKVAAGISCLVVAASPWFIDSIFILSPENHYFFLWSLAVFLIGVYDRTGRKKGWYRNNTGEGFLILLGVVLGVLCIYHFFSFSLLLLLFFAVVKNVPEARTRKKMTKLASMVPDEEQEKKRHAFMPILSQIMILVSGILIGGFFALLKYTGYTGYYITQQFKWWLRQFKEPVYDTWQDLFVWLPLHLAGILMSCFICYMIAGILEEKKKKKIAASSGNMTLSEIWTSYQKAEKEQEEQQAKIWADAEPDDDPSVASEGVENAKAETRDSTKEAKTEETKPEEIKPGKASDDWRFDEVVDDWRFDEFDTKEHVKKAEGEKSMEEKKVKYLDNPLPVPKKHVKKVMDFEKTFEKDTPEKDDFDFEISHMDDFDV